MNQIKSVKKDDIFDLLQDWEKVQLKALFLKLYALFENEIIEESPKRKNHQLTRLQYLAISKKYELLSDKMDYTTDTVTELTPK